MWPIWGCSKIPGAQMHRVQVQSLDASGVEAMQQSLSDKGGRMFGVTMQVAVGCSAPRMGRLEIR